MTDENEVATEEETDELPEVVVAMQSIASEINDDLQRIKNRKRELVLQARANQLTIVDVITECFDELISQQSQMLSVAQAAALAADASFVYCDDLAEHTGFSDDDEEGGEDGEDGDEDEEDGSDSWLSKDDANLIGASIVMATASIKDAQAGRDVDWSPVLTQLESAGVRITAIEEKPEETTH
jgi:hypothetical protein